VEKLVSILGDDGTEYKVQAECANLLTMMAKRLVEHKKLFIGLDYEFIIKILEGLTCNRIARVQSAARTSLKAWRALKSLFISQDTKKQKKNKNGTSELDILTLKAGDGDIERLSKLIDGEIAKGSPALPQILNLNSIQRGLDCYSNSNMVDRTYLKQKAHNFVKKNTGLGGGNVQGFSPYKKSNKSKNDFILTREKLRRALVKEAADKRSKPAPIPSEKHSSKRSISSHEEIEAESEEIEEEDESEQLIEEAGGHLNIQEPQKIQEESEEEEDSRSEEEGDEQVEPQFKEHSRSITNGELLRSKTRESKKSAAPAMSNPNRSIVPSGPLSSLKSQIPASRTHSSNKSNPYPVFEREEEQQVMNRPYRASSSKLEASKKLSHVSEIMEDTNRSIKVSTHYNPERRSEIG